MYFFLFSEKNDEYKTENSNLKSKITSIQHEQTLSSADYKSTIHDFEIQV